MVKLKQRGLSLLLVLVLLLSAPVEASAAGREETWTAALADTAQLVYSRTQTPQVGSVGGDWAVLGLARSGQSVPEEYYRNYYAAVESYVKACGGVLHERKYTEYSRLIAALSSIGRDARDVAGYDLTKPLGDYEKTVWQGINGPIWALIALDSRDYPVPRNPEAGTQATRQMYIGYILDRQLSDGGWSLGGGTSDPDVTAMALQALARYQSQSAVRAAVNRAVLCLSGQQEADGGFSSEGVANSESVSQVIVALCELGISLDDPRFVKDGHTLLDHLMTYYQPGQGFRHMADGSGSDQMATEQALCALSAAQRAGQGKNSLYCMDDAPALADGSGQNMAAGLAGKHPDVETPPVTLPGKTFPDIASGHPSQTAVEVLAARGIIAGYADGTFGPDDTMTRAQFAAVAVRALGLPQGIGAGFSDVKPTDWCAAFVGSAYQYGIVKGTSATTFSPNATITRQEAAVMVARGAKLCGLDTEMDDGAVRDALAPFTDYMSVGAWARPAVAFCYSCGIWNDAALEIRPQAAVKRSEVAQMVYKLLEQAALL